MLHNSSLLAKSWDLAGVGGWIHRQVSLALKREKFHPEGVSSPLSPVLRRNLGGHRTSEEQRWFHCHVLAECLLVHTAFTLASDLNLTIMVCIWLDSISQYFL